MKIKSITPTNKYSEIRFQEVIDDPVGKKVYTPSGFQPVLACEFMKRDKTVRIETVAGVLFCHREHRLLINRCGREIPMFAYGLDPISDKLIGYHNSLLDFSISDGPVDDLYDIELPDPHWWFTSGIVSHNSILLCNCAISSLKCANDDGTYGQDVLLITFELDSVKTALRCLATTCGVPINQINEKQDYIRRVVEQMKKTYKKKLLIHDMPPDECSVNHIYALLDNLRRTEGWKPSVIILDYMDLMVSRNPAYNKDDYTRQKHVSNEIRGLAKNEDVLIFTATQTNRSGADGEEVVDLTKASESFGKLFAMDYVISLNQSKSDRAQTPPRINFYIAKNRNGPKHESINCEINYDTMVVKELL